MGGVTCDAHAGSLKLNIFSLSIHASNFIQVGPSMYQLFCANLLFTKKKKKGWLLQKFLLVSALEAAQIILKELCPSDLLLLP